MTDHAELVERLMGVHHAMLDWAEDFRRVGSIDGEMSEKSRAELLKSAATALDALVAERDALKAQWVNTRIALNLIESDLGEFIERAGSVDVEIALAFEGIRAALAQGGGE